MFTQNWNLHMLNDCILIIGESLQIFNLILTGGNMYTFCTVNMKKPSFRLNYFKEICK